MALIDEGDAVRLANIFKTLSDPSRIRLISVLLDGEINVGSLAELVGISESAASHQLRTLRQMRLVSSRRQGRQIFYKLNDAHVADIFQRGLDHVRHD